MPTFRRLVATTDQALSLLGIGVLLVGENASIEVLLPQMARR